MSCRQISCRKSYEDLLNPKLKNGKIWVDVSQAAGLAALFVVWGKDKLIDYATKLGEQKPVWTTGNTRSLTAMAAGVRPLQPSCRAHVRPGGVAGRAARHAR